MGIKGLRVGTGTQRDLWLSQGSMGESGGTQSRPFSHKSLLYSRLHEARFHVTLGPQ